MGACSSKEVPPSKTATQPKQNPNPAPAKVVEQAAAPQPAPAKPAADSPAKPPPAEGPKPDNANEASGGAAAPGNAKPQVAFTMPEVKKEPKPATPKKMPLTSSFLVEKRTVKERYDVGKELGRGCFGVVRVCTDRETGTSWALKCIQKSSLKSHTIVEDEVRQLKKIGDHPNVVKLYDFFEDFDGNFYIVMELCRGGDLFTRIVNQGSYSESLASQLLRQLGSAIKHMHDNKITHRDLKPENILLTDKSPNALLKVVDFGLSKFVNSPQGMMSTVIGTWAYCAPEVFSRRPYTDAVDNWALGVLMFIMLSGYHPFDLYGDSSEAQLIDNICSGKFNFDEPEWQDVSEQAKSVIAELLHKDPAQRMSIEAFLNNPWVAGNEDTGTTSLDRSRKRLQLNISSVFNLPPPESGAEATKPSTVEEGHESVKTSDIAITT